MALSALMKPGAFAYSELPTAEPMERHFSPYTDNGGSIVAVAGKGFAIIASDTRLSTGYSIYTRDQPKLYPLNKSTVLGCTGCWCDVLSMTRLIEARMKLYKHEHQKDMSPTAVAQMIATILYSRRFFPYYVSNVVAGLDAEGQGAIYSYDPVGHCEKSTFHAGGSSGALLQPLLDNQVAYLNMQIKPEEPLSLEKALGLIKDVFISAAERDIYTGDGIQLKIVTKDGIKEEHMILRHD